MYIYKYILKNLDSLRTVSLLTDSEVSLGLIVHLITYACMMSRYALYSPLAVSQFEPCFFYQWIIAKAETHSLNQAINERRLNKN